MMNEYKEIVVALIAVFGAVLPYLLQKNKELEMKRAEQKRDAYANFLGNFTETALAVMHNKNPNGLKSDRDRMHARDQLLLYGSDEVIRAYDAWVRHTDLEGHGIDKEGELISLIFLAIRKDLLGKTTVTKEHISSLSPYERG
jgi:hypothetical protein